MLTALQNLSKLPGSDHTRHLRLFHIIQWFLFCFLSFFNNDLSMFWTAINMHRHSRWTCKMQSRKNSNHSYYCCCLCVWMIWLIDAERFFCCVDVNIESVECALIIMVTLFYLWCAMFLISELMLICQRDVKCKYLYTKYWHLRNRPNISYWFVCLVDVKIEWIKKLLPFMSCSLVSKAWFCDNLH